MTHGIVFILHSAPNAVLAGELADALVPHVAIAIPFTSDTNGRQAAYGSGATCIILLDEALAAHSEAVFRSAPPATSVVCLARGVALRPSLSGYSVVEAQADLKATAEKLRDAVSRKQSEVAQRDTGRRQAAVAPAMRRTPADADAKSSMLTRSAWGLAATVVVAGIAAPAIGGRAGASSVADADPISGASEASDVMTVAQPIQIAAAAPQHFEPPPLAELLDHIDQTPRAAPGPSVTALAAEEPAAPEPLLTSLIAPGEPDVSGAPISVVAPVAHAGQPKGGAAPAEAPEKPQATPEPDKPSP